MVWQVLVTALLAAAMTNGGTSDDIGPVGSGRSPLLYCPVGQSDVLQYVKQAENISVRPKTMTDTLETLIELCF